jgi:hypothetical protein
MNKNQQSIKLRSWRPWLASLVGTLLLTSCVGLYLALMRHHQLAGSTVRLLPLREWGFGTSNSVPMSVLIPARDSVRLLLKPTGAPAAKGRTPQQDCVAEFDREGEGHSGSIVPLTAGPHVTTEGVQASVPWNPRDFPSMRFEANAFVMEPVSGRTVRMGFFAVDSCPGVAGQGLKVRRSKPLPVVPLLRAEVTFPGREGK